MHDRAGGSRREQERRPRWELGEQLAALAVARRRNTSEQECVGVGMRAQEHAGAGDKHWCEVRGMSGARDWWRAMRARGSWSASAGAQRLPSTETSPPPSQVLVETSLSGHPSPRQVAQQDHRESLSLSLPLDLAAGDHRRRNTAAPPLLCFGLRLKDLGLEESKIQGVMCTTIDSDE
jgi:hypothetical protein